jgi:hypothetical protein
MKHNAFSLFLGLLLLLTAGCSGELAETSHLDTISQSEAAAVEMTADNSTLPNETSSVKSFTSPEFDHDDLNDNIDGIAIATIDLTGDEIYFEGSGASVDGNTITITSSGAYQVSGTLNDGQIIVDTQDDQVVRLILNGVDLKSTTSASIYINNATKTIITLVENTTNSITDGEDHIQDESGEPNAAIFSKDDLTINGKGALIVNGNFNHGIYSKDELKIIDGNISVNAINDGLKGRDLIALKGGQITIMAGGDGMQSNNGDVFIEGGFLVITAQEDGIQAKNTLYISGGDIYITTGGGSALSNQRTDRDNWGMQDAQVMIDAETSAKGLKAGATLMITGGSLEIDSADDSLHSNDIIIIEDGKINLASGDDAVHADSVLVINGGVLKVSTCYEGLESAAITINGGDIHIIATDDGINGASGDGNAGRGILPGMELIPPDQNMEERPENGFLTPDGNMPENPEGSSIALGDEAEGSPGQGNFSRDENIPNQPGQGFIEDGSNTLEINGGYIFIDANGDGIDMNGTITMTGGVVIVNGPTVNNENAIDYNNNFGISGGYLIAVGSIGMAQSPSTTSNQYSVMINLDAPQSAGTLLHLATQSGDEICTFSPTKAYQSVIISTPELRSDGTYHFYTGGQSSGSSIDGLLSSGIYYPGSLVETFTISNKVTTIGESGGGFFGGQGDRMPRRP